MNRETRRNIPTERKIIWLGFCRWHLTPFTYYYLYFIYYYVISQHLNSKCYVINCREYNLATNRIGKRIKK